MSACSFIRRTCPEGCASCRGRYPGKNAICLIVFVFIVTTLLGPFAQAQVSDDNFPSIEHSEVGVAGTPSSRFLAEVRARLGVKDVSLWYRYSGESDYQQLAMQKRGDTRVYSAELDNSNIRNGLLEYYIVARDQEDNLSFAGMAFNHLTRQITQSAATGNSTTLRNSGVIGKGTKPIYVALGVLALVVLAGVAGGGSSSGNQNDDCVNSGCNINLNLSPP